MLCKTALTYRITLNLNYVYKTKNQVFRFMMNVKTVHHACTCTSEGNLVISEESMDRQPFPSLTVYFLMLIKCSETLMKAFHRLLIDNFTGGSWIFCFGQRQEEIQNLINMKITFVQFSFCQNKYYSC